LIAAHNEEVVIERTIQSIAVATETFKRSRIGTNSPVDFKVTVVMDRCTDQTKEVVQKYSIASGVPVQMIQNKKPSGKWYVLNTAFEQSAADWVAFIDCGSLLDPKLILESFPHFMDPNVMGVAPSYCPKDCGALERLNWKIEQGNKYLESLAGGPISVHGAAVFYRSTSLKVALDRLAGTHWLNDDVVVPLMLRLTHPNARIHYLINWAQSAWVTDIGVVSSLSAEYRRRGRMILGNIQWIQCILLRSVLLVPSVSLLSSRRITRVLWAYWAGFIVVGGLGCAIISGGTMVGLMILALGLIAARSNWVHRVAMAFLSGLQIPKYWLQVRDKAAHEWT
jgi:glycosyltransferase involved in cell wall biosynthesis